MGVQCSSHNLAELENLTTALAVHVYALRLLDEVEVLTAPGEYWFLLSDRISLLSQSVGDLRVWENALRGERDFNAPEPVQSDES